MKPTPEQQKRFEQFLDEIRMPEERRKLMSIAVRADGVIASALLK